MSDRYNSWTNRARFVQDRTPNIVTIEGTYINGEFVALFDLVDNAVPESDIAAALRRDARYMKYILAADTVRFVLRPYYPDEDNNGYQFPTPSYRERRFLEFMCGTFVSEGMKLFPVFVLPDRAGYAWKHPQSVDDFYANNNKTLLLNYMQYINTLKNCLPLQYCVFVDYLGDFDPLNVYGNHTDDEVANHRAWLDELSFFNMVYNNWFPEVVGSVDRPLEKIPSELNYLKDKGIKNRLAFQLYTDNVNYEHDFTAILQAAHDVAGDKMLIEEAGCNTEDFTDDGDYGRDYFARVFAARNAVCPNIPVGLWAWGSAPINGNWGWSLNKNTWDIRPCWWQIQEGASGIMWETWNDPPVVKAVRKSSNYIVFKDIAPKAHITIRRTADYSNHVKDAVVRFGQWDRPVGDNIGRVNEWWPQGVTEDTILTPDWEGLELWVAVDFNWIDPNLTASVEVFV